MVQGALEALPTIGTGNVTVSGNAGGPYTVTFTGARAGPQPFIVFNGAEPVKGTVTASSLVALEFEETETTIAGSELNVSSISPVSWEKTTIFHINAGQVLALENFNTSMAININMSFASISFTKLSQ